MRLSISIHALTKLYYSLPSAHAKGSILHHLRTRTPLTSDRTLIALESFSFEVNPGELFELLGPNRAGQSTAIGILTTRMIRPTGGCLRIGDFDISHDQVPVKRLIGVVQQRPNLDFALTGRGILLFHAAYFGVRKGERVHLSTDLLYRFYLADRTDDLARRYSSGEMQRLSLARALIHRLKLLILDEPSTGLDPQTKLLLWDIIREYNH